MSTVPLDGLLPNSQVIRVFPTRNKWTPDDEMAFVGQPPLYRPGTEYTSVRVSCTFTWERSYAEKLADSWRMYYRDVRVGGPAYDDPAGEFVPGRFLKHGCVITSRGCPKKCGWCKVPFSEGDLRYLSIKPGFIVQDNNLLACERKHLEAVFAMLREQDRPIYFNGGLDKHFLQPWHRELFDSIKIGELWFACDVGGKDIDWLRRAKEICEGISVNKMRCYTMIGYDDETLADAKHRCETVYSMGFLPFSQLYQPPTADMPTKVYSQEWKALNRYWSRPAIYRARPTQEASGDAAMREEAKRR